MMSASASPVTIDPATTDDRADIAAIRRAVGLPAGDLTDDDLGTYRILWRSDRDSCGIVAVESYNPVALLRSLAVHPDDRGCSLGQSLVLDAEAHARAEGVRAMYLLTHDQEGFFERLGYRSIDRDAVPPVIADTPAFRNTRPDAACMWKQLGASGFA